MVVTPVPGFLMIGGSDHGASVHRAPAVPVRPSGEFFSLVPAVAAHRGRREAFMVVWEYFKTLPLLFKFFLLLLSQNKHDGSHTGE